MSSMIMFVQRRQGMFEYAVRATNRRFRFMTVQISFAFLTL